MNVMVKAQSPWNLSTISPPYERDNGVCTRLQSYRVALNTGEDTRLSLARRRPQARGVGAALTLDQAARNVVTYHAICLEFLKLYCAHFLLAMLSPVTLGCCYLLRY